MNYQCPSCGKETDFQFACFKNPHRVKIHDPKYSFQIGQYCRECQKWIKWLPQTPELMTYLNHSFLTPPQYA